MKKWTTSEVKNLTGLSITRPLSLSPGDATLHLGWTLHSAPPNTGEKPRKAIAITYFSDGARVHPDLLSLKEGRSGGSNDDASDGSKGVAFKGEDGNNLYVQLLEDDYQTWKEWLHKRPSILIPGAPVRDSVLTPLLYDVLWDTAPGIPI